MAPDIVELKASKVIPLSGTAILFKTGVTHD